MSPRSVASSSALQSRIRFSVCQSCKHFDVPFRNKKKLFDGARNNNKKIEAEAEARSPPPPGGCFASFDGVAALAAGAACTGCGGVMLDAGPCSEGPDGSACSSFFPKHGKQLILPFRRRFPVAGTLYAPATRAATMTTRSGQEHRAHARAQPPALFTARRPCRGLSARTRRVDFIGRHGSAAPALPPCVRSGPGNLR
jgi:hypothetical protein